MLLPALRTFGASKIYHVISASEQKLLLLFLLLFFLDSQIVFSSLLCESLMPLQMTVERVEECRRSEKAADVANANAGAEDTDDQDGGGKSSNHQCVSSFYKSQLKSSEALCRICFFWLEEALHFSVALLLAETRSFSNIIYSAISFSDKNVRSVPTFSTPLHLVLLPCRGHQLACATT